MFRSSKRLIYAKFSAFPVQICVLVCELNGEYRLWVRLAFMYITIIAARLLTMFQHAYTLVTLTSLYIRIVV